MKEYIITLPPEGLILREFVATALAHIAYYAGDIMSFSLEPTNARITFPDHNALDIAKALHRFFEEAIERIEKRREYRPSLIGNDWKSTIPKWAGLLSAKLGVSPIQGEKWDLILNCMRSYSNWVVRDVANLYDILNSLSLYESGGRFLIKWGSRVDVRSLEALALFKANYYAGRRGMVSKWTESLDAKVKLDEHVFAISLAGAIMAKQGVFKPGEQNIAVYLSLINPGAIELKKKLSSFITRVRCRLSPDVVFRIASAMAAYGGGISFGRQPLRLITLTEGGNRVNVISVIEFEYDEPLIRFLENLSKNHWAYLRLGDIMEYTLDQWESRSKENRLIVEIGYMLAHAILLSCSGSLSPEEALYNISRVSFASVGREFEDALKNASMNLHINSLKEFASLIRSVYLALRGATSIVRRSF